MLAISPIKVDPLNLESQNQAIEHTCCSPESLIKAFEANQSRGS